MVAVGSPMSIIIPSAQDYRNFQPRPEQGRQVVLLFLFLGWFWFWSQILFDSRMSPVWSATRQAEREFI